ncbi:beta-lactamase/transpeptidase-like protein [Melanogaster broomeanus]|nr:beta-lactamase/transpeptidase-like protein [Melanogaster broomeanus]
MDLPKFHTWGYRTEDGDEMTPDTLFHMASVSKAFCATALGLLIDDFANGRNVTGSPTRINRDNVAYQTQGSVARLAAHGRMYMVGAHVIATYTDKPYTSFVEERIFSPLGMVSSTFSPEKAESSGKFSQGWTKDGRRIPEWFSENTAVLIAGPGGIISSAVDMSKWISTWINEGVHEDNALHPSICNSIAGYGMGWARSSYRGHDMVYHSGSVPGLSTLVSFLPSDEIGVTVFANGGAQAETVMKILNRILDEALHLDISLTLSSAVGPSPPKATVTHGTWSPRLSLNDFAGTYTNAGYGTITLCAPSRSSTSSYCSKVQSDFTTVDNVQGNSVPLSSYSQNGLAYGHRTIRMRYQQGSIFQMYFTTLFPDGYGKDTTPFETGEIGTTEGTAEFVIEDGQVIGFGISGLDGQFTERFDGEVAETA